MTRVLLVEPRAGRSDKHFTTQLEALASAMRAAGHDVHVLVSDHPTDPAVARGLCEVAQVHVPGVASRRAIAWTRRLATVRSFQPKGRVLRAMRHVADALNQMAMARAVATCAARAGGAPALVLSSLHVDLAPVFAPRSAQWAVYELRGVWAGARPPALFSRVVSTLAARRERQRRRRGGWVRLVANNRQDEVAWKQRRPWLESTVLPVAGVVDTDRLPVDVARRELGLDPCEPHALLFGRWHDLKDLHTAFCAFAGDDAPGRLVAAGEDMAAALDATRTQCPDASFANVIVFDGPQSDARKRLLYSAADAAILSFKHGSQNDSGTLADAVGYRVPVCCSDSSVPAELVRHHRLGHVFTCGDVESLRTTLPLVRGFEVHDDDRARFMASWSIDSVARRLLAVACSPDLDAATAPSTVR